MSSVDFETEYENYQSTVFNLIDDVEKNDLEKVKINNAKLLGIFAKNPDFEQRYIENTNYMPLYLAAMNGYLDIVKYLVLEGKADINQQDWFEAQTALHMAVENEHKDVVEFLIQNGANINLQNHHDENTALHMALEIGNIEIINILVRNGADLNIQNKTENTALHMALEIGNIEIINILANVNKEK